MGKKKRNYHHAKVKRRIRRANTAKIINKLLQSQTPSKRKIREEFKMKYKTTKSAKPPTQEKRETLKFGSINIDGIIMQKHSALQKLIFSRGFDVRIFTKSFYYKILHRYWPSARLMNGMISHLRMIKYLDMNHGM